MFQGFFLSEWANVATVVATAFGIPAVIFAWLQWKQARDEGQEAYLNAMYQQFLGSTLQHPEFISPDDAIDMTKRTFANDSNKFLQYEVYVDLMLATFEPLWAIRAKEDIPYMKLYLEGHKKYLSNAYFWKQFGDQIKPDFAEFLNQTVGKKAVRLHIK